MFGLNLLPMKLEQVAFFVLALVAVFTYWARDLRPGYRLALVGILGFSPVFWAAKDNVLSDLPFLLFFYTAAVIAQRASRDEKNRWVWSLLLGLTLYAAIGTRTVGIALIAGLVLFDLLQYRKISRFTGTALIPCMALILLQSHFLGSAPGGYMEQVHAITLQTIRFNLAEYARVLAGFWVASVRNAFSYLVLGFVAVLTLTGAVYRYKHGITVIEAFVVPYLGILILWPYCAGVRAVFPVIPWMVFLALSGLRRIIEKFASRYAAAAAWCFVFVLAVPFGQAYRAMDFGPIRGNQGLPEFNQLCAAVRNQSTAGDVFVYYRARALSLYTGRPASTYNYRGTDAEFGDHLQQIRAAYLITTTAFDDDHGFLDRYVQDHSVGLDLTYQNAKFRMYRIARTQSANRPASRSESQSN
jgi:4-amino-4-deoxy-L-arabinose transferase-like glycosyltransferase